MTKLVAIINLTPDSFSGDGLADAPDAALACMRQAMQAGAHSVDLGAQSTRPGADLVTPEEEWRRLAPVLERLPERLRFSIDTLHPATARRALAAGCWAINYIAAESADAEVETMMEIALAGDAHLMLTHAVTAPADPTKIVDDPLASVIAWAQRMLQKAARKGLPLGRVILDPGIGFGKSAQGSWALLRGIGALQALGAPVLVGHSRKSFLGAPADREARDLATLFVSGVLMQRSVDYLRVHDARRHRRLQAIQAQL